MKTLGVEKRDIYVALEFQLSELRNIASFLEKGLPLFIKVFGDTEDDLVNEIQQLNVNIEKIIEEIDNGS